MWLRELSSCSCLTVLSCLAKETPLFSPVEVSTYVMFTTKKLTQDHSQSEVSTERLNMTSEASVISPHGQARVLLRVKWFEDT